MVLVLLRSLHIRPKEDGVQLHDIHLHRLQRFQYFRLHSVLDTEQLAGESSLPDRRVFDVRDYIHARNGGQHVRVLHGSVVPANADRYELFHNELGRR